MTFSFVRNDEQKEELALIPNRATLHDKWAILEIAFASCIWLRVAWFVARWLFIHFPILWAVEVSSGEFGVASFAGKSRSALMEHLEGSPKSFDC